jgi:hypothetical protein
MSAFALDLPVSPELVLVSPPEQAALARELLPDPAAPAAPPAQHVRALGVAAFWAFCVANCVAPFALSAAAASL